jgi:hypothetical protein
MVSSLFLTVFFLLFLLLSERILLEYLPKLTIFGMVFIEVLVTEVDILSGSL